MERLQLSARGASYFPFGIQISSHAWNRYHLSQILAQDTSGEGRSTVRAVRHLTDRLNESRASGTGGRPPARTGELLLGGVLQDVLRYLVDHYWLEEQPESFQQGIEWARQKRGASAVDRTSNAFAEQFPPQRVHLGKESLPDFCRSAEREIDTSRTVFRELILVALANENAAMRPYVELFEDGALRRHTPYPAVLSVLEDYFATQPPMSATAQTLFEVLRAPMKASPDSLDGQLRFILDRWRNLLPASLWKELTFVQDIVHEETRPRFFGPGPAAVLRFGKAGADETDPTYPEEERFSMDLDWMSNVVLLAKTVYVWLDQLSKEYQRHIYRLDQVPDEELDKLARWGFNGLWLIGVWERSSASQKIKQAMGNPEALSSAYSLYDYVIANDLGGEEAYQNLRDRAAHRGIRLASDMVPNHTGIYSKWVVEHPDWYIQLPYTPYPGYSFNGHELSYDDRVSLKVEDGYWSHSDAAVVFRRVDRDTGETRYIYHGNDGTNMPWNDTAQLNYLLPEVREAVIQTILHVARMFPIIRFDAAMTLAKRHFQRLWFPKPGDGGAVPSRAEHGMSKAEFDRLMPKEFWREVVDRCAQEAPDTLLLAEAFWLMEGYFVRTLGMHRVYNSAFMNMLKMEQNAEYRTTVRNVLEFSPEVLKRFVNFMNNPDELTAVEQFGKGDKYFGAAMLMVTMPGLPMFGHGQVEGYTEKYGMEYRRPLWDERADQDLIRRHEAEIFPLLHKRYLFSGVKNFAFFDFEASGGWVDENVFAYSNRTEHERALVLYNNSYNTTSGRIIRSVPTNVGEGGVDKFLSVSLAEALALRADEGFYYVFRDYRDNQEYIRSGRQLAHEGLFVQLRGYQYHAFLDFREVHDTDGSWGRLADELRGSGVHSIQALYNEMTSYPVARAFRGVMNVDTVCTLAAAVTGERPVEEVVAPVVERYRHFLGELEHILGRPIDIDAVVRGMTADLNILHDFMDRVERSELGEGPTQYLREHLPIKDTEPIWFWRLPVTWAVLDSLHEVAVNCDYDARTTFCVDDWDLLPAVRNAFNELGYDWQAAELGAQLVRLLVNYRDLLEPTTGNPRISRIQRLMEDEGARQFLQVNRYEEILWFNQEQLEALVYWLFFVSVVTVLGDASKSEETRTAQVFELYQRAQEILEAAEQSQFRVTELLRLLT